MSKKINLILHETDIPIEKWHEKIKQVKDNGIKLKMLVIEKIMANPWISAKEVQDIFFISPRLMYKWVKEYNEGGLEALKTKSIERRGSGKGNTKVSDEVYQTLKEHILRTPNEKWTLKKMQSYLKKEHGIYVTQQSIAYRIKVLRICF